MNEKDRIERARRIGAERARQREIALREQAEGWAEYCIQTDDRAVREKADSIAKNKDIKAMGPDKTPDEWEKARRAIRETVIAAARRREKVIYSCIQIVAYESVGLKLGHLMLGRMCAEINQPEGDQCLLSSIIVSSETGRPGEGFEEFAAEQGFPETLSVLQHQVFEESGR